MPRPRRTPITLEPAANEPPDPVDAADEDLSFGLSWENAGDVLTEFFAELGNRGLTGYRQIIQTGGKAGESYFSHVLDLVLLLDRLQEIVALENTERRCLLCACAVHDLNKVLAHRDPASATTRYAEQASEAHIRAELEALEADRFFRSWPAYLPDITAIAQLHQGNYGMTAAGLDRTQHARFLLGWPAVQRLGRLLQAADVLASSRTLEETVCKNRALDILNAASSGRRFHWLIHRVAEQRGLLTNLIHNCAAAYVHQRFAATDLLRYPDGIAYLVPEGTLLRWEESDVQALARQVEDRLAELQRRDLSKFIRGASQGITVDAAAFASGASIEQMFEVIAAIALRRTFKADWIDGRRHDLRGDLEVAVRSGKLTGAALTLAQECLAGTLLPGEPAQLRCGELLTGYRNFLNAEAAGPLRQASSLTPAQRAYRIVGIPREHWPAYDAINAYRWGSFLSASCQQPFEQLAQALLIDLQLLQTAGAASESAAVSSGAFTQYLRETVEVQTGAVSSCLFRQHLQRYVNSQHRQCCLCSSIEPAKPWMSANAPASVNVQLFSNRLEGGSNREPKRYICPVCRTQFILERLAWRSHDDKRGSQQTTFYLHLFPHAFFTTPFLVAWYQEVERLRGQDLGAFFVQTDAYFREPAVESGIPVRGLRGSTAGVALPGFPEALGNTPVLPLHARGQSYGEQYLQALETAAILAQFYDCRALLSRLPTPIVDLAMYPRVALFVEGMPHTLGWLLHGAQPAEVGSGSALDARGLAALLDRLRHLHALKRLLWSQGTKHDLVHALATAAAQEPLRLYAEVDRLIERKVESDTDGMRALGLTRAVLPALDVLLALHPG
ncbi:MAG: type I-D CRISPR-associated protein Cas10d/Csc3 [Chloroflexi bacterium]|nr:type I-D CRISPR-associated protein Cas10d/Csc3 [Chloroflexota bacterium]